MSARVTFGNINGHTEPVEHVSLHTDEQREAEEVVKMMAGRTTPSLLSDGLVMRRHSSSSSDPDTNTANRCVCVCVCVCVYVCVCVITAFLDAVHHTQAHTSVV